MNTSPDPSNSDPLPIGLRLLDGEYSVCKLPAGNQPGQPSTGIFSLTVTERETSLVCATGAEPEGARIEAGWRALYVDGPIPFGLTGVVAGITSAVASAGHPVFVISTFDSDLLFLQQDTLTDALSVLRASGYCIDAGATFGHSNH
ncbi:ACT domain-containing protein [Arthrobacter sp. HS15c]|uniref:ACT domain-containing protein n=1 Tax=Arthrobacter sp. HS15c TaxID=3230279 RepID=UPI0034673504